VRVKIFWQKTVSKPPPAIVFCNWGRVKALRIMLGLGKGFIEIQYERGDKR